MSNKNYIRYIINSIELLYSTIVMLILYPFIPKNIWIISERINQAQDNGIAFFKYLNTINKDINSYYLIEKNSDEIDHVKDIGNILIYKSLKHKIIFLKSNVLAMTEKNIIEPWGSNVFYKYFAALFPQKKKVFLQHGIIDKDVSHIYGRKVSNFDMFITSTEEEKNFVVEKFGYEDKEVRCTGLARYDYLEKGSKENVILFMPTWRRNLVNPLAETKEEIKKEKEIFMKSDYYKKINSFLNNEKLLQLLKKYNYKLVFVTHHMFDFYNELFKVNDRVVKCRTDQVKIQSLLSKSKIFITDYSSVHFDSAYIENINIYYQFDKNEFFETHANKSYFDYEKDAFGQVLTHEDELIELISHVLEKGVNRDKIYDKRVEEFFKYLDKKNCSRIFNEIKNNY